MSTKTTILPQVRVTPEFRELVEQSLAEGETLSEFVEEAVRSEAARRSQHAQFLARGLHALEAFRRTGEAVDAEVLLDRLQGKLDAALASRRTAGKPKRSRRA